jgi:hypothetical protein
MGRYNVFWAVPTSGFGEPCDEQPLPLVVGPDGAETPRYGGQAGWEGTGWETLPLPSGRLAQPWPLSQRLFNLPRRRVNLYWRHVFRSRTPADGQFLFATQLSFRATPSGFAGRCPLVRFGRQFRLEDEAIRVVDRMRFRRRLRFATFTPVVIALLPETPERVCLEVDGFRLAQIGDIRSSTGDAVLWGERLEDVCFSRGDEIVRTYRFCLAQTARRGPEQPRRHSSHAASGPAAVPHGPHFGTWSLAPGNLPNSQPVSERC